jgi:cell wall-associated NlpC family hydrolase
MYTSASCSHQPLSPTQRQSVVDTAMTWLRTPYHHQARVKGAGADCAMFPLAVYQECGFIAEAYQSPAYSSQWHLHRSEELYIAEVEKLAVEKAQSEILPADFVIFKFGRTFSHGAIVVNWPIIIHSYIPHGVALADASNDAQLIGREMKLFEIQEKRCQRKCEAVHAPSLVQQQPSQLQIPDDCSGGVERSDKN